MQTYDFNQEEWHAIVSEFEDLSLIQTWEYGEAKAALQGWRVVRHVWHEDGKPIGAAQAVVKNLPLINKGLVWINRAPLCRKKNHEYNPILYKDMLKSLFCYWVKEHGMYLRIAPALYEHEENLPIIQDSGFKRIENSQWVSAVIDLALSADEIRSRLDKKWRNCLAKAEKLGITFEAGLDDTHMSELVADYRALLARKEFSSVTPEFILHLQRLLPSDRKLWIICARDGMKKLGSVLIARYGNTAEYFIGAVGPEGRARNVGQFLLWNAIIAMKRIGMRQFDLGGIHPEKTPKGILHFKQGVYGVPYTLVGEFDAVGGLISRGIKLMVQYRS